MKIVTRKKNVIVADVSNYMMVQTHDVVVPRYINHASLVTNVRTDLVVENFIYVVHLTGVCVKKPKIVVTITTCVDQKNTSHINDVYHPTVLAL